MSWLRSDLGLTSEKELNRYINFVRNPLGVAKSERLIFTELEALGLEERLGKNYIWEYPSTPAKSRADIICYVLSVIHIIKTIEECFCSSNEKVSSKCELANLTLSFSSDQEIRNRADFIFRNSPKIIDEVLDVFFRGPLSENVRPSYLSPFMESMSVCAIGVTINIIKMGQRVQRLLARYPQTFGSVKSRIEGTSQIGDTKEMSVASGKNSYHDIRYSEYVVKEKLGRIKEWEIEADKLPGIISEKKEKREGGIALSKEYYSAETFLTFRVDEMDLWLSLYYLSKS